MRLRHAAPARALAAALGATLLLASGAHAMGTLTAPGAAALADGPDVVTLTKGSPLKGRVVYEDKDMLLLRVGTKEKQIAQAEIAGVKSITRSLNELLDKLGSLDSGLTSQAQTDGLLELANFAASSNLPGEARLLFLRVVLGDPENPAANAALGNHAKDGKYTITHNKRPYSTKELANVGKEWGDRWILETTHYKILSNVDLPTAVDAAFDLERQYRAFYTLLQQPLRLLDIVEEKMLVELHGDKSSFPERGDNRKGYYNPGSFTLFIDASGGIDRGEFAHEATHEILFVTTQRTRGAKGQIPAWLDEGMAEYFKAALGGQAGHASFTFGSPVPDHLKVMKKADKLLDLNRLLTLVSTDFQVSTDAGLKYAECWALLQFGLHGADGAHHKATMDFIKSTYEGKSSMSDFKKAIAPIDADDFEKAFFAWADKAA
ncbi:MAG TPA: DUF1570 domain-containing protein [Planctomycetota bacterium]|nr:DUF1570 domain-containing protein [Planctomycetota bacterium]